MILKGLYDTKIDRMKEDKYNTYMMHTFGILINQASRHVKIKGFIISGLYYDIYVPNIIGENEIEGFMMHNMRRIGTGTNIVEVKEKIKEDIKSRPEYYIQLANIMKEVMKK